MQNMNNEFEELQAAIKAYEQLAPQNKSIQEILAFLLLTATTITFILDLNDTENKS